MKSEEGRNKEKWKGREMGRERPREMGGGAREKRVKSRGSKQRKIESKVEQSTGNEEASITEEMMSLSTGSCEPLVKAATKIQV